MVWELVATAVQGLNAGAGLQAALAGPPTHAADGLSFTRFVGRTRLLGLLLSTLSTASAINAYYAGGWVGGCAEGLGAAAAMQRGHAGREAAPAAARAAHCHTMPPLPAPSESRGALWLAAAAGVGIGIPFNLLMMAPPTAVLSAGAS